MQVFYPTRQSAQEGDPRPSRQIGLDLVAEPGFLYRAQSLRVPAMFALCHKLYIPEAANTPGPVSQASLLAAEGSDVTVQKQQQDQKKKKRAPAGPPMVQQLYAVEQLGWAIGQAMRISQPERHHWWISQATLVPGAKDRRISSIFALNACWVAGR